MPNVSCAVSFPVIYRHECFCVVSVADVMGVRIGCNMKCSHNLLPSRLFSTRIDTNDDNKNNNPFQIGAELVKHLVLADMLQFIFSSN